MAKGSKKGKKAEGGGGGGKKGSKGKAGGKGKKGQKSKQDMELAKKRKEQEEAELAKLEAERQAIAEKKLEIEQAEREGQLVTSNGCIQTFDQWVLGRIEKNRQLQEWRTFIACRNIPDFVHLSEVNAYLEYWKCQLDKPNMKTLLKLAPELLQVIDELKEFLQLPAQSCSMDMVSELGLLYHDMIIYQQRFMDRCTYSILQDLSDLYDPEVGIFEYLLSIPQLTHCLWGNMFQCPDYDGHNFEEVQFQFKIPEDLVTVKGVYRLIKTEYDHYSASCKSFFPPAVDNALKRSIQEWIEKNDMAALHAELASPEEQRSLVDVDKTKSKTGKKKKGKDKGKKDKKGKKGKKGPKSDTDSEYDEETRQLLKELAEDEKQRKKEEKRAKKEAKKGGKGKKGKKGRGGESTTDFETEDTDAEVTEAETDKEKGKKKKEKAPKPQEIIPEPVEDLDVAGPKETKEERRARRRREAEAEDEKEFDFHQEAPEPKKKGKKGHDHAEDGLKYDDDSDTDVKKKKRDSDSDSDQEKKKKGGKAHEPGAAAGAPADGAPKAEGKPGKGKGRSRGASKGDIFGDGGSEAGDDVGEGHKGGGGKKSLEQDSGADGTDYDTEFEGKKKKKGGGGDASKKKSKGAVKKSKGKKEDGGEKKKESKKKESKKDVKKPAKASKASMKEGDDEDDEGSPVAKKGKGGKGGGKGDKGGKSKSEERGRSPAAAKKEADKKDAKGKKGGSAGAKSKSASKSPGKEDKKAKGGGSKGKGGKDKKKGKDKSKSKSKSPKGKKKGKGKKGKGKSGSRERPKTEAELAKERERAEKAQFIPPLRENELNLRMHHILGGTYSFQLLDIPPQPTGRGRWTIHMKEYDCSLKEVTFQADFSPPLAPDMDGGAKKTPEEMEKEAKKQEEELQKLVLGNVNIPTLDKVDPEEEAERRAQKEAEEKAEYEAELNKQYSVLLEYNFGAPKRALWFEPPIPVRWDPVLRYWSQEGFYDIKFDERTLNMSFRTTKFGIFGLGHNRWLNLPYQTWELRPMGKNKVMFSLTASMAVLEFIIHGDLVCCSNIDNVTNAEEVRDAVLNKFMRPHALIKTLRGHNLDVFPEIDSYAYVDGILIKNYETEDHLYQCMALTGTAFNFQWSRWNLLAGREKCIFQIRERHGTASPANYQMCLNTPRKCIRIDCTEVSPSYSETPIEEFEYYADLLNLVKGIGTPEALNIIAHTNPHHVEAVRTILTAVRPLTFS